jgi:chromosome segregation ATPase
MSQQPRRSNGQFGNKLSPAPKNAPATPDRNQLAEGFDNYDALGKRQEQELQSGLSEVGDSIDAIIEIYKQRSERREKEIEANQRQLAEMQKTLDDMSAQRQDIENRYREQQQKSFVNRVKRFFHRG